jgi:hypothetical protein
MNEREEEEKRTRPDTQKTFLFAVFDCGGCLDLSARGWGRDTHGRSSYLNVAEVYIGV